MRRVMWVGWMATTVSLTCCVIGFSVAVAATASSSETVGSAAWQPVPENGMITAPGKYYLPRELQTDRSTAIKVDANNVTIDLCGHAIRYTGTPKEGTFGIEATGRTGVTILNGVVGGYWFNIHCTQNERLRIRKIRFDDIPYIGINVAQSRDVEINDNVFENFRYDLPKDADSTYVIGINIGAKDAVIVNNRFAARPRKGTAKDVAVETVFVLFSAQVSKDCLVAKNSMTASELLPRSYGVWVATNADATIVDNDIQNMKYSVCLASDAAAFVGFNRIGVSGAAGIASDTIGVSASGAKDIVELRNSFDGVATPTALPNRTANERAEGG